MTSLLDHASLRQAAAALDRVISAGQQSELKERIATDWRQAREVRMSRSIGYPIRLAAGLRDITKANARACESAVTDYLSPSYSHVALSALLEFAAELDAQAREPITFQTAPSRAPQRRKARVA